MDSADTADFAAELDRMFAERMAKFENAKKKMYRTRAEFKARRNAGLIQRHQRKLGEAA